MIACVLAGCASLFAFPLQAQSNKTKCDSSLGLAQMQNTQQPKGRLQDAGAPQTVRILKLGKNAIPMLIACLTDETETKEPIEDFWPVTTVGDVAFFYLCDLFTDSTWEHSTINGVINWKTVQAEDPNSAAWTSWYEFVKKHGRKYVQDAWSKRWKEEESAIFWEAKEQCFKVGPPATQGNVNP
jgi:hypothetical protein